jgi:hypothetical protein
MDGRVLIGGVDYPGKMTVGRGERCYSFRAVLGPFISHFLFLPFIVATLLVVLAPLMSASRYGCKRLYMPCSCHALDLQPMQYVSSLRGMALVSSPSFSFDVLCSRLMSTFLFRSCCSLSALHSHATLWTILYFLGSSSYQRLQLSLL